MTCCCYYYYWSVDHVTGNGTALVTIIVSLCAICDEDTNMLESDNNRDGWSEEERKKRGTRGFHKKCCLSSGHYENLQSRKKQKHKCNDLRPLYHDDLAFYLLIAIQKLCFHPRWMVTRRSEREGENKKFIFCCLMLEKKSINKKAVKKKQNF